MSVDEHWIGNSRRSDTREDDGGGTPHRAEERGVDGTQVGGS